MVLPSQSGLQSYPPWGFRQALSVRDFYPFLTLVCLPSHLVSPGPALSQFMLLSPLGDFCTCLNLEFSRVQNEQNPFTWSAHLHNIALWWAEKMVLSPLFTHGKNESNN